MKSWLVTLLTNGGWNKYNTNGLLSFMVIYYGIEGP